MHLVLSAFSTPFVHTVQVPGVVSALSAGQALHLVLSVLSTISPGGHAVQVPGVFSASSGAQALHCVLSALSMICPGGHAVQVPVKVNRLSIGRNSHDDVFC